MFAFPSTPTRHCICEIAGPQATGGLCSTVDVYNGDTGEWTWTNLTRGRYEFAAASVGDAVVVAGGKQGGIGPQLWNTVEALRRRHHLGPFLTHSSAMYQPPICAVKYTLLSAFFFWFFLPVAIGLPIATCNPMFFFGVFNP